ncbi:hypothetical protein [Sphingomonas sp. KR3-1]|uniref:hypothetical protein n=1 Tax=Sphingomonas sp. KR3-1 TaxID=3156611 RepID=UPI0032B373CE
MAMDTRTFERMRRTLGIFATECKGIAETDEIHPVRVLDAMHPPAVARKGLQMAVSDIVEELSSVSRDHVARLDARLAECDAMTLSEARLLFSRRLRKVRKRGVIANEDDYYLVRNAIDFAEEDERDALWVLLADFEGRG